MSELNILEKIVFKFPKNFVECALITKITEILKMKRKIVKYLVERNMETGVINLYNSALVNIMSQSGAKLPCPLEPQSHKASKKKQR